MQFSELVKGLLPGQRVRITFPTEFTPDGKRIWSDTLTDARMLAYWNHAVLKHKIIGNVVACILGKPEEESPEAEDEAPGV